MIRICFGVIVSLFLLLGCASNRRISSEVITKTTIVESQEKKEAEEEEEPAVKGSYKNPEAEYIRGLANDAFKRLEKR